MDINRILVEIDPRKDNAPAIERARRIARASAANVRILACESLPPLAGSAIIGAAVLEEAQNRFLSDLRNWAEAQARPLTDDGIDVSVEATWAQPRHESVVSEADAAGADLVIRMASRHNRLERMFLGANDWELIRHLQQALWLVQAEQAGAGKLNFLAAVDPTHARDREMILDRRLLETAGSLAAAFDGELHVYHAVPTAAIVTPLPAGGETLAPPMPDFQPEFTEKVREQHRARLDELVGRFDIPSDRVHLVEGDATRAILDVIEEHAIDVVVAGAISRSWIERLLIGSTAESLFNAIDCDLLVVKAGESGKKATADDSTADEDEETA